MFTKWASIFFFLVLLLAVPATGKELTVAQAIAKIKEGLLDLSKEELKTPQSELEDAIKFIVNVPLEDQPFIRFFSLYTLPPELRQKGAITLSFVCHSLIGPTDFGNTGAIYPIARMENGKFVPYQMVTDTLVWIDLRDFNWTAQAWEKVSLLDGYFAEPIVSHYENSYLRLIAGNAIIRADWFIEHATNSTAQTDSKENITVYEELLYAQSKIPKTIEDYEKVWGIDRVKARKFGNEYLALVTESQNVARHNRILAVYRVDTGYYYVSYDVINDEGNRNYLESIFRQKIIGSTPDVYDAGEFFNTNYVGLQVYGLFDGQNKLINEAAGSVARHLNDVKLDSRVRVGDSCMDCHAAGPIPSNNIVLSFVDRAKLVFDKKDKQDYLRFQRAYLNKGFGESVTDNQIFFGRSLYKITGLKPADNGKNFLEILRWYNQRITPEVAAFECGVDMATFNEKMTAGPLGLSLKLMVKDGHTLSRTFWESQGKDGIPGGFQQAMILLHGLTVIVENEKVIETIKIPINEELPKDVLGRVYGEGKLMSGKEVLAEIPHNTIVTILDNKLYNNYYVRIKYNDKIGYISHKNVRWNKK